MVEDACLSEYLQDTFVVDSFHTFDSECRTLQRGRGIFKCHDYPLPNSPLFSVDSTIFHHFLHGLSQYISFIRRGEFYTSSSFRCLNLLLEHSEVMPGLYLNPIFQTPRQLHIPLLVPLQLYLFPSIHCGSDIPQSKILVQDSFQCLFLQIFLEVAFFMVRVV